MKDARHLVIFARYPKAGAGKRRLAAGVGDVQAVRFSRVRLAVLVALMARDTRWTTWLAVTPDGAGPWPRGVRVIGQGRGDLGQRMGRVFRVLPPGRVVIVGSDCPAVRAAHVARAFGALGGRRAVFGPASDGGYWLVGLDWRGRMRVPFEGVRWSGEFALGDTVDNVDGPVAMVEMLDDVDDARDLARCPAWGRVVAGV
jgi:uncharacterized protein